MKHLQFALTTLALVITNVATGYFWHNKGMTAGVEGFHSLCYHVGGIFSNHMSQTIMCMPVSSHSQQNNQEKLDKHPEI